jgi:hypothetical protein
MLCINMYHWYAPVSGVEALENSYSLEL